MNFFKSKETSNKSLVDILGQFTKAKQELVTFIDSNNSLIVEAKKELSTMEDDQNKATLALGQINKIVGE